MSIDTRLSAGLRAEVELMPEVETVESWATVLERTGRERAVARTRSRALGAIAVAAAIAVVVLLVVRPGADRGPQPAPRPSPTATSSTLSDPPPPLPFEGTWQADGTGQDVVDHLRSEGLAEYAAIVLKPGATGSVLHYSLKLSGGQVTMLVGFDGEPPDVFDVESFLRAGRQAGFHAPAL